MGIQCCRLLNWMDHHPKTLENYVKFMKSFFTENPMELRLSTRECLRTTHSSVLHIGVWTGHSILPSNFNINDCTEMDYVVFK